MPPGAELARNDDGVAGQADSALQFTAPKDGTYRVRVADRFGNGEGRHWLPFARRTLVEKPILKLTLASEW